MQVFKNIRSCSAYSENATNLCIIFIFARPKVTKIRKRILVLSTYLGNNNNNATTSFDLSMEPSTLLSRNWVKCFGRQTESEELNSWKWTGIYIVPIYFGSPKTIYSIAHELALNRSTSKSVATLLWEFSPSYRQTRLAPWKTYSSEYIVSNYTALCNTTTAAKTL